MPKLFRPDAKVIAMVDDLSRRSLTDLMNGIGYYSTRGDSTPALRQYVKAYYEAGKIDADSVTAAWEDDTFLD